MMEDERVRHLVEILQKRARLKRHREAFHRVHWMIYSVTYESDYIEDYSVYVN